VVASSVPALVIAAPASGSGKTTVATGLMGALRRAGRRAAPFKVGPDFIDPGYHALAAQRPGRNLDPVLVGERLIGRLYRHGSAGADIAVVDTRETTNYIKILSAADPAFARAWSRYRRIAAFDGLAVYRRGKAGCLDVWVAAEAKPDRDLR